MSESIHNIHIWNIVHGTPSCVQKYLYVMLCIVLQQCMYLYLSSECPRLYVWDIVIVNFWRYLSCSSFSMNCMRYSVNEPEQQPQRPLIGWLSLNAPLGIFHTYGYVRTKAFTTLFGDTVFERVGDLSC